MNDLLNSITTEYNYELQTRNDEIKKFAFVLDKKKISRQLSIFLNLPGSNKVSRIEIYRKILLYSTKNQLLNTNDELKLDEKLKKIFSGNLSKCNFRMVPELIEHHFK